VLATCWQQIRPKSSDLPRANFLTKRLPNYWRDNGRWMAGTNPIVGVLITITVAVNLGYQKYYTADRLVPIIRENSSVPVLIATTHQSLVQVGELMGIAWELHQTPLSVPTQFLLAHQARFDDPVSTQTLTEQVKALPRPLDVWAVNFVAPVQLDRCEGSDRAFPYVNGYGYQLYHCR